MHGEGLNHTAIQNQISRQKEILALFRANHSAFRAFGKSLLSPAAKQFTKRYVLLPAALALAVCFCASCRSIPPLPPADLSVPGWRVQQGQAIWKPTKTRPELTGEILLATHSSGDFFVEFAKTPFALASAQVVGDRWQIEFGSGKHSWRGRGEPPSRFVWFQLSRALSGAGLGRDWQFERQHSNSWLLLNRRTGESLEGGFFP